MAALLEETVAAYIRAINNYNAAAFIALFADGAVVNDVGREFRGPAAIKVWRACEARPGRSARPGLLLLAVLAPANHRITIHFVRRDEGDVACLRSRQDVRFRGELLRRESWIETDEDL